MTRVAKAKQKNGKIMTLYDQEGNLAMVANMKAQYSWDIVGVKDNKVNLYRAGFNILVPVDEFKDTFEVIKKE